MMSLSTNYVGAVVPDGVLNIPAHDEATKLDGLTPIVEVTVRHADNANFTFLDISDAV